MKSNKKVFVKKHLKNLYEMKSRILDASAMFAELVQSVLERIATKTGNDKTFDLVVNLIRFSTLLVFNLCLS